MSRQSRHQTREPKVDVQSTEPTFIDLFCGCGGFTLGMQRAGFRCLAAIDLDGAAVKTLRRNLTDAELVLKRDLTLFPPKALAEIIDTKSVDVVVGGPPCQGFSIARQVDGANHGRRLTDDPRRYLYREFLRYVEYFQPKVFIMENVLGFRSAEGGIYYTAVQQEARELGRKRGKLGYRVHSQIENAWELGVPQKRHRQLIVGVRNDIPGYFPAELTPAPRARPFVTLGVAIGDLPILRAGGGDNVREYDLKRRDQHINSLGEAAREFMEKILEINEAPRLTNHVARPHSDRDLRDFALLREGETSAVAMRVRGVDFEFPYDKESFKDRYTRQSRRAACSTIVAHLSKDGLMFVHPTQNRSLTPREAARIQGFPDWFVFPNSRVHAFRLIGNAVPPLVAEAVGLEIAGFLDNARALANKLGASNASGKKRGKDRGSGTSRGYGLAHLRKLLRLKHRDLQHLPKEEFLAGWHALLFYFPELHPDGALDHGKAITTVSLKRSNISGVRRLLARRYARSGWPVALEKIGEEGWRRFRLQELSNDDFYHAPAQYRGLMRMGKIK